MTYSTPSLNSRQRLTEAVLCIHKRAGWLSFMTSRAHPSEAVVVGSVIHVEDSVKHSCSRGRACEYFPISEGLRLENHRPDEQCAEERYEYENKLAS